jgi:hypothetical protein
MLEVVLRLMKFARFIDLGICKTDTMNQHYAATTLAPCFGDSKTALRSAGVWRMMVIIVDITTRIQ